MKRLIDSAFLHVDQIGPHVFDVHYDLVLKSQGTILLPELYEVEIKPGSEITIHMRPRPPPPPHPPPVIIDIPLPPPQMPRIPLPPPRRPRSWSDYDSNDSTNSDVLASDSEIKDEPEDLGIEIDYQEEVEKAELGLGELLGKWTNATDLVGDNLLIELIDECWD